MSDHLPDVERYDLKGNERGDAWVGRHADGPFVRYDEHLDEILGLRKRILELEQIARAAQAVCAYDWSDNDDEAVAAMDRLNDAVGSWLARKLVPTMQESQLCTTLPGELAEDIERKLMIAVREADDAFEKAGATGTKNWVREFLLTRLEAHGLGIGLKDHMRAAVAMPLACPGAWPECPRTDCQTQMRCVHGPAQATEAK